MELYPVVLVTTANSMAFFFEKIKFFQRTIKFPPLKVAILLEGYSPGETTGEVMSWFLERVELYLGWWQRLATTIRN
jgi:hypothetical protein